MCVRVCVCLYIYVYIYICICICIYVCVYIFVCVCIYIYLHLNPKSCKRYINVYMFIYAIMKIMCPPVHHHNGFVATHALGHMMCTWWLCAQQSHCGDNPESTLFLWLYITWNFLLWDLSTLCRGLLMATYNI